MRKFKGILEDTEQPSLNESFYPAPPAGVSTPEMKASWRVQCLMMSAEVRYSMYLQLLEKWVTTHPGAAGSKDQWPLPPW
jgi:hypothetical protein